MSFINPLFLLGLAAAALPVLFHFVRKMKAKKVPFGSLMFLKATPKELIKKRRLRDILLMMLRVAMFALLALAFARPFLPQDQLPFLPERDDESIVILIDQSYSMQVGDLFEQAKQQVLERIDAAEGGEIAVVGFSDEARLLTPLGDDRALHRSVVESLEPTNRATDFYNPFRLAAETLQDARYDHRTVVLVSDFQQNGWTGALDNWSLDAGVVFVPVRVEAGAVGNASVEDFVLTTKRTGPEVAVRYDARIRAEGRAAEAGGTARLAVEDQPAQQQTMPPLASRRVSFQQVAAREGFFQGSLDLDDDDLALDNRYYFTYAIAGRPSVLAVDDNPRGGLGDAFFLRNAFALGDDALYSFDAAGRQRLTPGVLRNHSVVFLADAGAVSASQIDALTSFVEEGGSVVISAGPSTSTAALSSLLGALGLGTAREVVSARSVQGTAAIIGEVDLRHPIFEPFAASGRGAILRPTFRRYLRVEPDSAAIVLGTFDTDDPFLIERRHGRGKALVYSSSWSTAWTDFPLNEVYVPFLYQLVRYALRSAEARHQFTVGDVVALQGRPAETWDVRTPDGRLIQVAMDEQGAGFFRETDTPGHYEAALGRQRFPFSVNIDPRESLLAARDMEEAYAAVAPPSTEAPTTPEAAALVVEDEEKKQKLWRVLLLLAIGLFVAETILANRRAPLAKGRGKAP